MSHFYVLLFLSAFSILTAAYPSSPYRIMEKPIDGCPCKILLGGPGAERRMNVAEDYTVLSRDSYKDWMAKGRPRRLPVSPARRLRAKIDWILKPRRKRCAYLEIKEPGDYVMLVQLLPGEEENDVQTLDITRKKCKPRSIEDFGDSNDADECDNKQVPESALSGSAHIVNGHIVLDKDWYKYNVKITALDREYHEHEYCTGSLIGDRWVLTAAHCKTTGKTLVHIGSHMKDGKVIEGEIRAVIDSIQHANYRHPELVSSSSGRRASEGQLHDIQILMLNETVSNYREKTVAVNTDCRRPVPCRHVLVSGYGAYAPHKCAHDEVLRSTFVEILGHDDCQERLRKSHLYYTAECVDASPHICASHDMCDSGLCDGDSGGPLVVVDKEDKAAVQVGISSYITGTCGERGHPDIYTRVSLYAVWIKENTDDSVIFNPPIDEAKECPDAIHKSCETRFVGSIVEGAHTVCECPWCISACR